MFRNEDADTFNKCSKAYEQGRADAINECIKKLAESEDTILSDVQYYILEQLKEQNI